MNEASKLIKVGKDLPNNPKDKWKKLPKEVLEKATTLKKFQPIASGCLINYLQRELICKGSGSNSQP